jgi:predicted nucleic acid-binding protein
MILIDSNIFMYAAGAEHPNKHSSLLFLEEVALGEVEAGIDAEVLEEILHRYRAVRRWEDGRQVYDLTRQIVPTVLPVTVEILDDARSLLDQYPQLMARDALHAAAARSVGADALCSFDRDLDGIDGVVRKEPGELC